jgi:hypothetical protein
MERRGFSFGWAGEEWSCFSEQCRDGSRRATLAKWGISGCCEDAFDEARTARDGIRQGLAPDVRALTRSLAHGAVAPALAEYVMDTFANDEGELVAFAELIASGGEHRAAPARLMLALEAHYVSQRRGTGWNSFTVRFSAFRRRSAARMTNPQKFETCSVTYWRYLPRGIAVCRTEEK